MSLVSTRIGLLLQAWAASVIACPLAAATEPPTEPLVRLETGMHTARISSIDVDAAGRYLVTGSYDKTVRVWELATGRLLQTLRLPQDEEKDGRVYSVALSPDVAIVAAAGWTGGDWDRTFSIYLFDRAGGRLLRRLPGLEGVIFHLTFSADGKYLAAAGESGERGEALRIYRCSDWQQMPTGGRYYGNAHSVDFDRQGRLVTTSSDGIIRLYDRTFKVILSGELPSQERPYFARFSPDGQRIVVGSTSTPSVRVLSGTDLRLLDTLDTGGVDNGTLTSVAWSASGQDLYAAGDYSDNSGWMPILHWGEGGRGPAQRWRAATTMVFDLKALPDGNLVFAAGDPAWGVLDGSGRSVLIRRGDILDYRNSEDKLRLSEDGTVIEFGFNTVKPDGTWDRRLARFRFSESKEPLRVDESALPGLRAPNTRHYVREDWMDRWPPEFVRYALRYGERSRSVAFATQGERFVLGTNWYVRLYDNWETLRWAIPVSGDAWAVNLSADGRYVVAALGDGTIRWYETDNGREVLALFVHPDGKRWIAWTPEGFFDAAPEAQTLIGYHLSQGKERAGQFVSAAQLSEQFLRPDLIAQRLGPKGDRLIAEAVEKLGDVRGVLAAGLPPELELLSPAQGEIDGEYLLQVRVKDSGGGVGKLIYRIDGVEVQGRPLDIPGAAGDTVGRKFALAAGERVLTVAAVNRRGVESKPVQVNLRVKQQQQRPKLFVLAVGVTDYRDNALRGGVKFAAADAQTVAATLRSQSGALFRTPEIRTLRDRQATRANIEAAVSELAGEAGPEDVFVIYLAGHGTAVEGEYYFLPWEVRYTNHRALLAQSLSREALQGLLKQIPARKTLLVLDTCSSAAFAGERGRGLDEKAAIDRMARISGRAVLAAAGTEQMALEGEHGHGVFTYALLEGLKRADRNNNGEIEVGELADYVEELVPEITREKWHYEQFPFRDMQGNSFPVATRP